MDIENINNKKIDSPKINSGNSNYFNNKYVDYKYTYTNKDNNNKILEDNANQLIANLEKKSLNEKN